MPLLVILWATGRLWRLNPFLCMSMAHQYTGKPSCRHHDWRGRRSKGCMMRCSAPLSYHHSAHENRVHLPFSYKFSRYCGVGEIHQFIQPNSRKSKKKKKKGYGTLCPSILAEPGAICFAELRQRAVVYSRQIFYSPPGNKRARSPCHGRRWGNYNHDMVQDSSKFHIAAI